MTSPVPFDCSGTCTLELDPEAAITLVAAPRKAHGFSAWTGACKGNGACYVTLAGARSVTALFGGTTFRLTVTVFGKGRVSSTPEGVGCAARCSAAFKAGSETSRSARSPLGGTGSPDGREAAGERVAASSRSTAIGLLSRRSLRRRELRGRLPGRTPRGWRAYLTGDEDAEDAEEVAVYCPACAAREFGGP